MWSVDADNFNSATILMSYCLKRYIYIYILCNKILSNVSFQNIIFYFSLSDSTVVEKLKAVVLSLESSQRLALVNVISSVANKLDSDAKKSIPSLNSFFRVIE
jgi:hypothetical protein